MNLELSDVEYRRLMLMAFLGEWMLNAIRKDPDASMEDALSKLYSFARDTPMQELVAFDAEENAWIPTPAFEDEAHALIDQYDDTTFWEELTSRLAERDLIERHGERKVLGMRPAQREREVSAIAKDYTREFEEVGLDRLRIME